jgi:hypothetical protein
MGWNLRVITNETIKSVASKNKYIKYLHLKPIFSNWSLSSELYQPFHLYYTNITFFRRTVMPCKLSECQARIWQSCEWGTKMRLSHLLMTFCKSFEIQHLHITFAYSVCKKTLSEHIFPEMSNIYLGTDITTVCELCDRCKVWCFHGDDYEECRLLGYKTPVRTSEETHYVPAAEQNRLMLCKIWGFHGSNYKECRLLGCYAVWLL